MAFLVHNIPPIKCFVKTDSYVQQKTLGSVGKDFRWQLGAIATVDYDQQGEQK